MKKLIIVVNLIVLLVVCNLLKAQMVETHLRIYEYPPYGLARIEGDLNSLYWNPASLVKVLGDRSLNLNLSIEWFNNKISFSPIIGAQTPHIPFSTGMGMRRMESQTDWDGSTTIMNQYTFFLAFSDRAGDKSFNAGVGFNYVDFLKEIGDNHTSGQAFLMNMGIIKYFKYFNTGFTWYNGARINWDVATVLDNEVPPSFNFYCDFYFIKKLDMVLSWTHLFAVEHSVNINSTKSYVLKDKEERFSLIGIYKFSTILYGKLGICSAMYNLQNLGEEDDSLVISPGAYLKFNSLSLNIDYQDNTILNILETDSQNKFKRIFFSIGYGFDI